MLTDVYPCVRYEDARAAMRWLVEVLGFRELMISADGDQVHHAELAFGEGSIMLGSRPTGAYGGAVGKLGPAEVYLAVDDIKAHYERVVAAGAELIMPLEDHGYGWGYTVRDPEGNVWSVGSYRPQP
jgi:uncharacterized glyoxalase superfamily protein PhnB